jgi:hypothetical protein
VIHYLQPLQQIVSVSQISNYKYCNNIVIVSQIWNYKQSVTIPDSRSCNQTLAPQQHSKQSVTTLGIGGRRIVGDGSPLAAVLIVGRGSTGGSTSPSVVATGEGDTSEWRALCVLRQWPSHGSEGGPSSSDICLVGGEHDTDLALRAERPMPSALPWTTSASRVEIRSPGGYGDSWWSVRPSDGGAAPSGSGEDSHRQACFKRSR